MVGRERPESRAAWAIGWRPNRSFQLPTNVAGNLPRWLGGIPLLPAWGLMPASSQGGIWPAPLPADPVCAPKTERSKPPVTRPVQSRDARSPARNIEPVPLVWPPAVAKTFLAKSLYLSLSSNRSAAIDPRLSNSEPAHQNPVDSAMAAIVAKPKRLLNVSWKLRHSEGGVPPSRITRCLCERYGPLWLIIRQCSLSLSALTLLCAFPWDCVASSATKPRPNNRPRTQTRSRERSRFGPRQAMADRRVRSLPSSRLWWPIRAAAPIGSAMKVWTYSRQPALFFSCCASCRYEIVS